MRVRVGVRVLSFTQLAGCIKKLQSVCVCLFFFLSVLLLLALKKIPITEHKTTHT